MISSSSVFAIAAILAPALFAQQPCEKLASLELPHTTITAAAQLPEGPLTFPSLTGPLTVTAATRCVVKAVAKPTSDSEIRFEVWLPVSGWNGKYEQAGNGGWAGAIPYQSMVEPLRRGYAIAATDDGHEADGISADWATGHPEKLIDFGYRAVHETRLQAEAIIRAFYGKDPARNYFAGCSDGGREALMEAQRYPTDFDGIVAGAPANNWSHLFSGFIWNEKALLNDAEGSFTPAKLVILQKAVLAKCDALDGVKDGLLEDPRRCHFDPGAIACKGADGPDCLTAPQVEAVRKIYTGPKNPRTGALIFPGYPPGTEAVPGSWGAWIAPAQPQRAIQFAFGNSYFADVVFDNPQWDYRTFNFDKDVAVADKKTGPILNSTNPDLRAFEKRGGKLIQYHGWGDAAISPLNSIQYYGSVEKFFAKNSARTHVADFYRLFLVPGMAHCGGGTGPNSFGNGGPSSSVDAEHDILTALDHWVEQGTAPAKLIGTGNGLTRPLCPYPQVAHYKGTGDTNDAASFTCSAPRASGQF